MTFTIAFLKRNCILRSACIMPITFHLIKLGPETINRISHHHDEFCLWEITMYPFGTMGMCQVKRCCLPRYLLLFFTWKAFKILIQGLPLVAVYIVIMQLFLFRQQDIGVLCKIIEERSGTALHATQN